jgi:hypothetical protein
MARIFSYYGALDIASAFPSKQDVGMFIEYMIQRLNEKALENKSEDYIPPIIYSEKGKVFNIHYNFIVNCLDEYLGHVGVKEDFYLIQNPSHITLGNCLFLVESILDDYYKIVRIRQRTLDTSRLKFSRVIEIKERFYNIVVIQNGENIKRFSAVPFSASEVKKIVSDSAYNLLNSITNKECFEQVAFGLVQFSNWAKSSGIDPKHVTE